MARQSTHSKNYQSIATLAFALALSISFLALRDTAAPGCNPLYNTAWTALEILRPVAIANLHDVIGYFFPNSCLLQHLPDLGTSLWPLLCALVG